MKHLIIPVLRKTRSLDEINYRLSKLFAKIKKTDPNRQIGYVSGIITAKGKDKSHLYIARLAEYTEYLRNNTSYRIFSATDIFTEEVFKNTNAITISGNEFKIFWQKMLEMGFVTDIFMTPEWDIPGSGAEDEHNVAKKLGITIHYIDPVQKIEKLINTNFALPVILRNETTKDLCSTK